MRRLVETTGGLVLIERNGPFGSLNTFGDGGWESTDSTFEGENELAEGLEQLGITSVEAARIASDYWTTWNARFAPGYYAEAQRFMRVFVIGGAVVLLLLGVAIGLILR